MIRLGKPTTAIIRAMQPGDSILVAGEDEAKRATTSIATRTGAKLSQRAVIVIDPRTAKTVRATLVYCETAETADVGTH